jgi:hypothetical protein
MDKRCTIHHFLRKKKIHYTMSYVCNTNMPATNLEAFPLSQLHTNLRIVVNKIKSNFKGIWRWYVFIIKNEIMFIRQFLGQGKQIFQTSSSTLKLLGAGGEGRNAKSSIQKTHKNQAPSKRIKSPGWPAVRYMHTPVLVYAYSPTWNFFEIRQIRWGINHKNGQAIPILMS